MSTGIFLGVSAIPAAIFILGIFIIVMSLIRKSTFGVVFGIFVGFIGAFYLFNLGRYPAFKFLQIWFDTMMGPFKL